MNLFNIYKKSLQIILSNPLITTYLVLFFILSSIFMGYIFTCNTKIVAIILYFGIFALGLCFTSGWLYIIKNIVISKDSQEKTISPSLFFEGIGKNIVPISIGGLLYTLFSLIALLLCTKFAINTFGSLDFITKDIANLMQNNNDLIQYSMSLSNEEKQIFLMHELSMFCTSMIISLMALFYFPAIIFNEKSNIFLKPIIAIKDSLIFLFKHFFESLLMLLCILSIFIFLQILSILFSSNFILSTIILICNIYFISIAVMLIFNYYGQKNNCYNGCNSIRENENIDRTC